MLLPSRSRPMVSTSPSELAGAYDLLRGWLIAFVDIGTETSGLSDQLSILDIDRVSYGKR
jgi:hypothetical protein